MRNVLLFLAGAIFGILLFRSPAVEAATNYLMFGSFSGAAKAVQVDTNGYVKVVLN